MLRLEKRGSKSIRKWWWALDNISLMLMICIILIGALLIITASPPVAERLKLSSFYFAHRQFVFLLIACFTIFFLSSVSEKTLKRLILLGFFACIAMMITVLFVGEEVKGARRWISVLGVSVQPSEILKPVFIFLTGLILAEKFSRENFPSFSVCTILYALVCVLLILQPDFGMVITYTVVLCGQFFLAGLPIWWIAVAAGAALSGGFIAYNFLPHVARRIDMFISPDISENFQVEKSLESYVSGGVFGRGPGEGVVKTHLPDSHTDFIFAVAGEEFGALFSSCIILVFLAFILRGLYLLYKEQNLFKIYVGGGIIVLFALQTIFNIGVTLHLFPTKGMTLPFISYGGSSIMCYAICFGIFLNFTKKSGTISGVKEILIGKTHGTKR
ncbi:MAG: putative lipid II flippase FtsW [Candidatus Jidaibacter sp.]|jgi:cell division protein FtsW|nr:putative lipid II flippase FtsW [Candidatus Jidaibacter sp.]